MSATSSEVKRRYNEKVYKQIAIQLKKELVEAWETKLAADGMTKAEFLRRAITVYLEDTAPPSSH